MCVVFWLHAHATVCILLDVSKGRVVRCPCWVIALCKTWAELGKLNSAFFLCVTLTANIVMTTIMIHAVHTMLDKDLSITCCDSHSNILVIVEYCCESVCI